MSRMREFVSFFIALAGLACGTRAPEAVGPPPIPPRSGPLAIDVVYPPDSSLISVRDSNFVFGSVGNGAAQLTINGQAIGVEPNGAFLAWLAVPAGPADTIAKYELVASLAGREIRKLHTVRLPPPFAPLSLSALSIDSGSVTPRGAWWVREGEIVPVRVRATAGAQMRLVLPGGDTIPLLEVTEEAAGSFANGISRPVPTSAPGNQARTGIYTGQLIARSGLGRGARAPDLPPVAVDFSDVAPTCAPPPLDSASLVAGTLIADAGGVTRDTAAAPAAVVPERADVEERVGTADTLRTDGLLPYTSDCGVVEAVADDDTVRTPLPLDLWILDAPGPVVELREEPSSAGRDGFVVGRTAPGATTLWMWSDGVRARVSGRRNGSVRIELDETTEAWVALDEVVWLRGAMSPARARVGSVRFEGRSDLLRARISLSQAVPYDVRVDGRRLTLVLYGAYSDTNWLRYGAADAFLRAARWEQLTSDRYLLHVDLTAPAWGYRVRYEGSSLILDIRKPPSIDPERPLAGRTIVVDPGHPPAGSVGPTRLYEGDANLAVAFRLKRLLEREGASVYLTRADRSAVRLYDRTARAAWLNAEILVSIHNNALPDGVNPFENHGTSVYYFQGQSLDLARALQRRLIEALGLHDLGIGRASLALARPAWMPAALTEGAFVMIPAQESGLRDPAFQEAYARGVLEGLRDFLRERSE